MGPVVAAAAGEERGAGMNPVRVGVISAMCLLVGPGVASAATGGFSGPNVSPVANSGDSGNVVSSSTATNTGKTGASQSASVANPVSVSGNSGSTGSTGSAKSVVHSSRPGPVTAA